MGALHAADVEYNLGIQGYVGILDEMETTT